MANQQTAIQTTDEYAPKTIEIGDFDPTRYNLLVRGKTVVQQNPFLKPVVRQITLDQPADTYPITQRKQGDSWVATEVGISAVGLANLASSAGLIDIPQASGRVDDGRDPSLVTYRATGALRMPDGEWQVKTRECTVKLGQLEKEIRAQKTAKAKQQEGGRYAWSADKLEAEISKELLLKEKFMERLAETGAKNRVTRALLGLASKYTPDEIRRPFVFMAVVPDMSQPELRARMLDQATSAIGAVFGPASGQTGAPQRLLSAGPSEADVASSDIEGGDLQADELEGAATVLEDEATKPAARPAAAAPAPTQEEPDWMRDATPEAKPAAAAKVDFRTRVRDTAAASDDDEMASTEQLASLKEIFAGVDRPLIAAGIHALFDDEEGPQSVNLLQGGQAQAILTVHDSLGHDEFERQWTKLAEKAAVAA